MGNKKEKTMVDVAKLSGAFVSTTWDHWKKTGGDTSDELQKFFKEQAEKAANYSAKYLETKDQQWIDNLDDLQVQSSIEIAKVADHLEQEVQDQVAETMSFLSGIAKALVSAAIAL